MASKLTATEQAREHVALEREKLKLRIEFWKAMVSLFLFCCCGLFCMIMPAATYTARVIAVWSGLKEPPTSALNDWACFLGVIALLAWGVNTMIPILKIFRDSQKHSESCEEPTYVIESYDEDRTSDDD